MSLQKECLLYLENEKAKLIEEFPKYEDTTAKLFALINEFTDNDFDGISENKIYRIFLDLLKEMVYVCFDSGAPKKYMRCTFIIIDNNAFLNYIQSIMKTKTKQIKFNVNYLVGLFIATWQDYADRDKRLNRIIELIDSWM